MSSHSRVYVEKFSGHRKDYRLWRARCDAAIDVAASEAKQGDGNPQAWFLVFSSVPEELQDAFMGMGKDYKRALAYMDTKYKGANDAALRQARTELHNLRMEGDYSSYEAKLLSIFATLRDCKKGLEEAEMIFYLLGGFNRTDTVWASVVSSCHGKSFEECQVILRNWSDELDFARGREKSSLTPGPAVLAAVGGRSRRRNEKHRHGRRNQKNHKNLKNRKRREEEDKEESESEDDKSVQGSSRGDQDEDSESDEESTGHGKRGRRVPKCFHCGKPGHKISRCWKLHPEQKPKNMKSKKAEMAAPSIDFSVAAGEIAFPVQAGLSNLPPTALLADSATSIHVFNSSLRCFFTNLQPCEPSILRGLGGECTYNSFGEAVIDHDFGGRTEKIRLAKVAYVPDAPVSLLAIPLFFDKGVRTSNDSNFWTFSLGGKEFMRAIIRRSGAPLIPLVQSSIEPVASESVPESTSVPSADLMNPVVKAAEFGDSNPDQFAVISESGAACSTLSSNSKPSDSGRFWGSTPLGPSHLKSNCGTSIAGPRGEMLTTSNSEFKSGNLGKAEKIYDSYSEFCRGWDAALQDYKPVSSKRRKRKSSMCDQVQFVCSVVNEDAQLFGHSDNFDPGIEEQHFCA